jgi:hypothetical protein
MKARNTFSDGSLTGSHNKNVGVASTGLLESQRVDELGRIGINDR